MSITLLRKIRQSLMAAGSTRQYLLYALGEIAFVVIGILVALQINNWNENRIRQRSLSRHLESLARSIEHDKRELSISMKFNEFRYHSRQYILKLSGIPADPYPDMPKQDSFIKTDSAYQNVGIAALMTTFEETAIECFTGSHIELYEKLNPATPRWYFMTGSFTEARWV